MKTNIDRKTKREERDNMKTNKDRRQEQRVIGRDCVG